MNTGTLTVLFEDPFWIGLFEKTDNEGLHVCKVTFGAINPKRQLREAEKQRQFDLRQAKRKEKHRGH